MQKKKTINAKRKTFLYYDEAVAPVVEFAKAWLKYKRGDHMAFPPAGAVMIEKKDGYVGSGSSAWLFQGTTIKITGHANGKGFWGTDYSIYLA